MKIPIGVNYLSFWKQTKEKGIRITSRFLGVTFNLNGGKPNWMARCQVKGRWKFLGRFEFTYEGEKKANQAYEKYLQEQSIEPRYSAKKSYKKSQRTKAI